MKRKISAILAADIAGYSGLAAEDGEETLRRLAMYRAVLDDFVARWGGRIFNTAGDAALAEFPSSVDAVRCALDIQESTRARNLAYPQSRQMLYRIGITVAEVVFRTNTREDFFRPSDSFTGWETGVATVVVGGGGGGGA